MGEAAESGGVGEVLVVTEVVDMTDDAADRTFADLESRYPSTSRVRSRSSRRGRSGNRGRSV